MAANDLGIIDGFLAAFSNYIDGGFGLLSGEVAFLSTTLIGIDVTLAGLFWAFGEGGDPILARLVRKVLYVGFFAWLLNDFANLSGIIYDSFAGLGLKASGSHLDVAALMKPGAIAATGFSAAHPLLVQASALVGFPEIFGNALTVFVLLLAWLLVIFAFFMLAIQLFISVLEFKLTTLAGFVLVPFALWNKTAFLAERVLGNVIASGIKMMVLAVIVGIGSAVFSQFSLSDGEDITMAAAMSKVLGALSLFGLGIFGPGIASGLVAGAPQLGAGTALSTAGAAAASVMLAGGATSGTARMVGSGSMSAIRSGAALSSGASTAYKLEQTASGASGAAGVAAGVGGMAKAAVGSVAHAGGLLKDRAAAPFKKSAEAGSAWAVKATGGSKASATSENSTGSVHDQNSRTPAWAKRLHTQQETRMHGHAVHQAIKDGDKPGHGANPSLQQKDD